jgi:ribonuclease P protein subunit POP4
MPISAENLVRHELIGLKLRVAESSDPTQKGLMGKVVDESYNTIKIETAKGEEKIIPKDNTIFIFVLPNGMKVKVDGKVLISRPEDRIKKKFARW